MWWQNHLTAHNQRGVHFVDPEGKSELALAADYTSRANIAESRGYSRYANILREVAEEYAREAEQNIESTKKRNRD